MQNRGTEASTDPWPPVSGPARGGEIPRSWVEAPGIEKGGSQVFPLPLVAEAPRRQPPGLCLWSPRITCGGLVLSHPVPLLHREPRRSENSSKLEGGAGRSY